jgi:drug/metabolite transporter (DMT)-like permease
MGWGEWAALAAAFVWTISSMLWGKIRLTADVLNFAKNGFGCVLLVLHLSILSFMFGRWPDLGTWTSTGWLALSALVGIAIGDTFFFRSLQILGPRLALVMATTAPLFGAVIGLTLFGERLPLVGWTGIALTLVGILVVVRDRRSRSEAPGLFHGEVGAGVAFGLGGALCQAVGGGLSKQAMQSCGELEATVVRTAAALVFTWAFVLLRGKMKESIKIIFKPENLKRILPAAAMGTWLGIWLSQIAFNQAPLAIALTLMATSPLFAIPLVHYLFGHHVTRVAILGSIIAVVGVYLVGQSTPGNSPERPAIETPAVETPGIESPAVETPAGDGGQPETAS